jgi:DNA-3-methyladenine glycosylase II
MRSRETRITVPPDYDFGAALAFLRASPSAVFASIEGETYRRAWQTERGAELVSVAWSASRARPQLRVRVEGPRVDARALGEAVDKVRHTFSLNVDAAGFQELAEMDPIIMRLVCDGLHARPVLIADPFESLVWAIIGQQVGVGFARTLRSALVQIAGHEAVFGSSRFPVMPDARTLADIEEEPLRAAHFSRAKIRALHIAAQAVTTQALDWRSLVVMPPAEAMAALTRFPGIGPWTAGMVLMRGLGVRSIWPAADLGLRRALAYALGASVPLTETDARALAAPWAGWEAWVAFFAWRSLSRRRAGP